jgi:HAD superfamily hydrolase (TIGR01509 family)
MLNLTDSLPERLRQRDCWIFDMDGTLTVANHDFEAIRAALDLPKDRPILEALTELPPDQAQPRWEKLYQIEWEIAKTTQAQPGAGALLERLRSNDRRVSILTRNSKLIAHETLAACGLLEFFEPEAILSRDCCAPKPQPDGILQILDRWKATPDRGVMVGDYVFDLLAGRNAGTATVHLDVTGNFDWPEHTDCCVTQLAELSGLLD